MKDWRINYKDIGAYLLVFFIGLLLLHLMAAAQFEYNEANQRLSTDEMLKPYLIKYLGGILMGVLVKWRTVLKIAQGEININLKLLPGIILGLISLFPVWFLPRLFPIYTPPLDFSSLSRLLSLGLEGLPTLFFSPFMIGGGIPLVLSVAAGVLMIEGLHEGRG